MATGTYATIAIPCPACQSPMRRQEINEQDGNGPRIELYQCEDEECGRRAALMYEPGGGLTDPQKEFVETEVRRMGAFFPGDYTGPHRR